MWSILVGSQLYCCSLIGCCCVDEDRIELVAAFLEELDIGWKGFAVAAFDSGGVEDKNTGSVQL